MKAHIDPQSHFERFVLYLTPQVRRPQIETLLLQARAESPHSGMHLIKVAAKLLRLTLSETSASAWLTAAFVLEIIVVTSALCGFSFTAGLAAGIVGGSIPLWFNAGHHYPNPGRFALLIDAVMAAAFCVMVGIVVFLVQPIPHVPGTVMRGSVVFGIWGLTILGLALRNPQGDPAKHRPVDHAYRWALYLNYAWGGAWGLLSIKSPHFPQPMLLLGAFFGFAPWLIVCAMFMISKISIDYKREDSIIVISRAEEEEVQRLRGHLLPTRGTACEILFAALAVTQFLAVRQFMPNFDRLSVSANSAAALMLVMIWRYIRKTNVLADNLLAAEEKRLVARRVAGNGIAPDPISSPLKLPDLHEDNE